MSAWEHNAACRWCGGYGLDSLAGLFGQSTQQPSRAAPATVSYCKRNCNLGRSFLKSVSLLAGRLGCRAVHSLALLHGRGAKQASWVWRLQKALTSTYSKLPDCVLIVIPDRWQGAVAAAWTAWQFYIGEARSKSSWVCPCKQRQQPMSYYKLKHKIGSPVLEERRIAGRAPWPQRGPPGSSTSARRGASAGQRLARSRASTTVRWRLRGVHGWPTLLAGRSSSAPLVP